MIQALRVNTLSKLTFDDSGRFAGLLHDIFPSIKSEDISYPELEEAIEASMKEMHLSVLPSQVLKIVQFYEALNQRMGVVLVGPSGSGKSTIIRVLKSVGPVFVPREPCLCRGVL